MAKDSVVDPAARDKYLLQVTAGPSYDLKTHQSIPVNAPSVTIISSPLLTCYLKVRIKDYHGLPPNSPSSSPYFSHPLHASDRYSIAFSFVPKKDLAGNGIVMGFDYDHSIKHQLPPGFKYAMKIATSLLDPGLYADAYCDEPYLYGPALSGVFSLNIGELTSEISAEEQLAHLSDVVEEGSSGSGTAIRDELGIPSKWKQRRKHFLDAAALEKFTFEKGRMYHADFFNPHLDFANFALRLPGFKISVARYIDEKTHHLRFVVKDRGSGETGFVVVFRLLFGEELEEKVKESKENSGGAEERGVEDEAENSEEGSVPVRQTQKTPTKSEPSPADPAPPSSKPTNNEDEQDSTASTTSSAISSLSANIHAAFVAMGLWDDTSSSSESGKPSREASPHPSGRSLEARVDDMDDKTVERYLQSKHGST